MSNALAIATVTRTLRTLLEAGVRDDFIGLPADVSPTGEISFTTLPPDKARENNSGNQINLFLYQAVPSAQWRNMDLPRQTHPGDRSHPPLALNLYYLVTAYGEGDNELIGHLLLGQAVSTFHDHPLLGRDELENALALGEVHDQIERVRITPQTLSLDEYSKLWSGFQTNYRLSATYEVSVLLIESTRPGKAPLPVLRRGAQDRGAFVLASSAPILLSITPPPPKPTAELGDTLALVGSGFPATGLSLHFEHRDFEEPLILAPEPGGSATEISVAIPGTGADPTAASLWAAGIYTVSAFVQRPSLPPWRSNSLPFALAPQITITLPASRQAPPGDISMTLTCVPQIRDDQKVRLLFGDREIAPASISTPADPAAPTTLTFLVPDVAAGEYVIRLRVDGVDSIPVDFSTTPPQFDPEQRMTIF